MSCLSDKKPVDKKSTGDTDRISHDILIAEDNDEFSDGKGWRKPKFRAGRFLRIHLQVLKALYQQESSTDSGSGDCHTKDKYWEAVEEFLRERNTIKKTTEQTQRMRRIYDEAKEFQKSTTKLSSTNTRTFSHQVSSPQFTRLRNRRNDPKSPRSNLTLGSSALIPITQPSPYHIPNRPSRTWNSGGCKSGGLGSSKRNVDMLHDKESNNPNAFGIVSGMLQRKYSLASRDLNRRTLKLRELVKESRRQIKALNSELIAEKDRERSIFKSPTRKSLEGFGIAKDESEDCQLRIETKIRLWKFLLRDLLGAASVVS